MIGKIERIPLREVWKHEAYDLTKWLEDNIDVLNEVLDLNLSNPESEKSAQAFSIDILAEDDDGNPVIIENQLEKSDHDHLGKIITYSVAMGSKTAIWIVANPRPEHIASITWLNESSASNFYLLKIEAIQIGDSEPAPLLTVIVEPSAEGKEVGKAKQEMSERYIIREKFWTGLLNYSRGKTKLFSSISPSHHNYLGTSAGRRGLQYLYAIRKHEAEVKLYIDLGKEKDEENLKIFNKLHSKKDKIEKAFGEKLIWRQSEGTRACSIIKLIKKGGYRNKEDEWPKIYEVMVEKMIKLDKAIKPYINKIKI